MSKSHNIYSPWTAVFRRGHPRMISSCRLLGLHNRPLAEIRHVLGRLIENESVEYSKIGMHGEICGKCASRHLCHQRMDEYIKSCTEVRNAYFKIRSAIKRRKRRNVNRGLQE